MRCGLPYKSRLAVLLGSVFFACSIAVAQQTLTVTPGRSTSTVAGTGLTGYAGDNSSGQMAALASPRSIVYDASGNLYIADARNHAIREVLSSGTITTVAGNGIAGFGGDGASATSAYLDTPTGVALDSAGNLYIADSHNHRIRKVTAGIISTIAGNGIAAYSGDNGSALSASLNLPTAVAVDASGNLYIADTSNHRIRKIVVSTISTVAGTGEQFFAGDGGAATLASLDTPTGVAVDTSGNIYIADRHNQRIRMVNASGIISTIAGSGVPTFSSAFGGDGGSGTAAALAKPRGLSVDASGNLYIADTNNQRIRQWSAGTIATIGGTGDQGFGGDGGLFTAAMFDSPTAVAPDGTGNLAVADRHNERMRGGPLPILMFTSQSVGVSSAAQALTLANNGSAPLTVGSVSFSGSFGTAAGGSCSAAPITIPAGGSCQLDVAYTATTPTASSGMVVMSGTGIISQTVLLAGSIQQAGKATTALSLASGSLISTVGQAVTFTAKVSSSAAGTPTGMVQFLSGSVALGSDSVASGSATYTTSGLGAGTYAITAVYSGDANFASSTSGSITQTIVPLPDYSIAASPSSLTIKQGQSGSATITVSTVGGFAQTVSFSCSGLPAGATCSFAPASLATGSTPVTAQLTLKTTQSFAFIDRHVDHSMTISLAVLFGVFFGFKRRKMPRLLSLCCTVLSIGLLMSLGCGSGAPPSTPTGSYTITVVATTSAGGAHSALFTVTVE